MRVCLGVPDRSNSGNWGTKCFDLQFPDFGSHSVSSCFVCGVVCGGVLCVTRVMVASMRVCVVLRWRTDPTRGIAGQNILICNSPTSDHTLSPHAWCVE